MADSEMIHRLDHVVVLMFENRSFDHLLGSLYRPGEVPAFEGIIGRGLSNPIPGDAPSAEVGSVSVHRALNRDTPDPDPGEEYHHVNTQLFGTVNPDGNRLASPDDCKPPFNAPDAPTPPTMQGFVADYINSFRAEIGRWPRYDQYAQIMAGYEPDQVPVLSTLARAFACFDHWFCEVPSQTYTNRSFFHAATSSGYLLNGPAGTFPLKNNAETIFERLETAKRSWRVYYDPIQLVSATHLVHGRRLTPYLPTNFRPMESFYDDARDGELPEYAFIEPCMIPPHSDMHPPGLARLRLSLHLPAPSPVRAGEALLARVYNAVRASASPKGSNFENTLLLVTFDEHGGTYDHVPPPAAPPPDDLSNPGQMGFRFDRSGVRIPTIAISAWIEPRTVVREEYRSTSVIQTLRKRWSLGDPLTRRDAVAADIAPVLKRSTPRPAADWPTVVEPRIWLHGVYAALRGLLRPLPTLGLDLVHDALALSPASPAAASPFDAGRVSQRRALRYLRESVTARALTEADRIRMAQRR